MLLTPPQGPRKRPGDVVPLLSLGRGHRGLTCTLHTGAGGRLAPRPVFPIRSRPPSPRRLLSDWPSPASLAPRPCVSHHPDCKLTVCENLPDVHRKFSCQEFNTKYFFVLKQFQTSPKLQKWKCHMPGFST